MAARVSPAWPALGVTAWLLAQASPAAAFEKQWHLGGGLGAAGANEFSLGPAVNLYGAYGLSDVFDLRLEGFVSRNEDESEPAQPEASPPTVYIAGRTALFYGAKLALAYKIDVIEWIPYAGVTAGFLGVAPRAEAEGQTADAAPFARANFSAGVILGLDYAISRSFGMGIGVSGDYAVHAAAPSTEDPDLERRNAEIPFYIVATLRAEYRFGW